ncbi:J domain-containing protein [Vacuolonema iberomarrocanum]|uniref:J domain-containing protein n=1 Tax=Vacuolonema iberomarrocanum TaxID=3454632 RepID=UPI001A0FBDBC|nr:J domain-containing protein [filamentous cyanobacterium LEGE 07170]
MSNSTTHYDTLSVSPSASQAEIKLAYRDLVKRFHPDRHPDAATHDRMATINVAYEVLSDPQRRRHYDRQMHLMGASVGGRQERTATAQRHYHQRRGSETEDEQLKKWILRVYQPVNRSLCEILGALETEINNLAADPFDDELMEAFLEYLEDSRESLQKAHSSFRSMPNPPTVAGVAAHLYYCLNQVGDGVDELERFTSSYNEHYLHTGQELFRIAYGLRHEAQAAMRSSVG